MPSSDGWVTTPLSCVSALFEAQSIGHPFNPSAFFEDKLQQDLAAVRAQGVCMIKNCIYLFNVQTYVQMDVCMHELYMYIIHVYMCVRIYMCIHTYLCVNVFA